MTDMKKILDYTTAPLVQWEPVIGVPPSEGKAYEDALIYPVLARELRNQEAQFVTGIIADEARLEIYLEGHVPTAEKITHLTLGGAFKNAADKNIADIPAAGKITVTTDSDDIPDHSQDAVVMNMILGCVSKQEQYQNLNELMFLAADKLKSDSALLIVRPNPEGGSFTTYSCLTPKRGFFVGGMDYQFTVKGLEGEAPMTNLYTPDGFLQQFTRHAGLEMGPTQYIEDPANHHEAPFLFNVCRPKV